MKKTSTSTRRVKENFFSKILKTYETKKYPSNSTYRSLIENPSLPKNYDSTEARRDGSKLVDANPVPRDERLGARSIGTSSDRFEAEGEPLDPRKARAQRRKVKGA